MQGSKIRLSDAEMRLFADTQVILTKNSVLQKTVALLSSVQEVLMKGTDKITPSSPPPKISKGENYLGLPYTVLDYPRISSGDSLFFIRSFFWWGNFYSSTLQLAGGYKKRYASIVLNGFEDLGTRNYFIGINRDPWIHHFEESNYKAINTVSKGAFSLILEEQPHIKIAARWPLQEWDSAANNLVESWRFFIRLIS